MNWIRNIFKQKKSRMGYVGILNNNDVPIVHFNELNKNNQRTYPLPEYDSITIREFFNHWWKLPLCPSEPNGKLLYFNEYGMFRPLQEKLELTPKTDSGSSGTATQL
jgi:hypothetical protein